jgi:hypothetical protein
LFLLPVRLSLVFPSSPFCFPVLFIFFFSSFLVLCIF